VWQYNNVRFVYDNEVGSVHGESFSFPKIVTYIKSKYALMEALRAAVEESYLGTYTEINPRSVKHDPPFKV